MNKNNNNNSKFFYSIASHLSSIFNGFGAEVALVGGLVRDLIQATCDVEDFGGEVLDYFNPKDYDVVYSSDQRKNDPEVLSEYLSSNSRPRFLLRKVTSWSILTPRFQEQSLMTQIRGGPRWKL